MRYLLDLLLGTSLVFSLSVPVRADDAFAAGAASGMTGSGAALAVTSPNDAYTRIRLQDPAVDVVPVTLHYQTFQAFQIAGEDFEWQDGAPAVPRVTRFYRIAATGSVALQVLSADFETVRDVRPLPLDLADETFDRAPDLAVQFQQDAWYPPAVAMVSEPAIMRDYRVVCVTLYPVQVNPVRGEARIYHNLDVELVSTPEPGVNELPAPRQPLASYAPLYRNLIANLDEDELAGADPFPGTYLIVARNSAQIQPAVDSLARWKRMKGHPVVVGTRANWTAQSLQTYIRQVYNQADPPLEFVCLMGDPVAEFGVPTNYEMPSPPWDHYFALMNEGDEVEDVGVGRLSGETTDQMATIIAKIMGYERNPYLADTTWYRRGFFYAAISEGGYGIASNYALMRWGRQQFANNTGVRNGIVDWHNGPAPEGIVRNQFQEGLAFFLWRGTVVNEMQPTLAWTCNSGWRLPVVATVTCYTGEFLGGQSVSESFLVAGTPRNPRGGICGLGSTSTATHTPQNVCLMGGLIYNMANLHMEHIGHCVSGAKLWLHRTFGLNSADATRFSRYNNLMGDPGLSIWTDVPAVMEAEHPSTLPVGSRYLRVRVRRQDNAAPVAHALVVLWKGDEIYARARTAEDGTVEVPLFVQTEGELLLTVTKRNHKPYLASIPCPTSEQVIGSRYYVLDDDNTGGTTGNADNLINPGETVDLTLYLKNYGSSGTATGISAELVSCSPYATLLADQAGCADLAVGDSAATSTPFRMLVSPQLPHAERLLFLVAITTSTARCTSAVELTGVADQLVYQSHSLAGAAEPGSTNPLTITLRNRGELGRSDVTARLVSLSPRVTVTDADGGFGSVPAGATTSNAGDPFAICSDAATFPGYQAPLLLVTSGAGGRVDSLAFTVTIGTASPNDPTGPDGYGYYAFDNTDLEHAPHIIYDYADASLLGGTRLDLTDIGEMRTSGPITSMARQLPFPFRFYGRTYDSITVCTNGWCAFGDQSYFDGWKDYPIPAMQAPDAMIAPYWDDLRVVHEEGLGIWEYYDATEHRYILQWKASGAYRYADLDFEVILLDEEYYPTADNNGKIVLQYRSVELELEGANYDVSGCTIGIQAPGGLVGLPLLYVDQYTPGTAAIESGRAILLTTLNPPEPTEAPESPEEAPIATFALQQNYPNPFNAQTQIRFDLPQAAHVRLTIYNSLGQVVTTLLDEMRTAGSHHVLWDGRGAAGQTLSSGLYVYRLEAGNRSAMQKMLLLK